MTSEEFPADEERKLDEDPPVNESDDLPLDPNGPPQPWGEQRAAARWGGLPIAACFIAAGGVVMGLMESQTHSCRGATRSARLKWQEQQALIEEAVQHDAQLNADDDAAR